MLFSTRDSDPVRDVGTWTHSVHTLSPQPELKRDLQCVSAELDEVIGCTQTSCPCECFQPGRVNLRSCDHCKHGWVAHAVSKLCVGTVQTAGQVEIVHSSVVFDISTLMLYGTQALPVRMKILLDRLYSVLTHTQVLTILHTLGWTLRDYVRGYILQDAMGKVLDRWVTMTPEDEVVTLQQFLRFGETKSIVELMAVQERQGRLASVPRTGKSESDIRMFIESSSHHHGAHINVCEAGDPLRGQTPPSLHHFENLPEGSLAFLQPFQYTNSATAPPLAPLCTLVHNDAGTVSKSGQSKQRQGSERRGDTLPLRGTDSGEKKTGRDVALDHGCLETSKTPNKRQGCNGETPGRRSSSSSGTHTRNPVSSLRKGRVSCGACGKTFYDKGTLKIHYNAVHLKIKHRCTVQGCNMVFSSLRSRNRHSANPNPRLHAPALHGANPNPHLHSPVLHSAHLHATALKNTKPALALHSTDSNMRQDTPAMQSATLLAGRTKPSLSAPPLDNLSLPHMPLTLPALWTTQLPPPLLKTTAQSPASPSTPTPPSSDVTKVIKEPTMGTQALKLHNRSVCESNHTRTPELAPVANQKRISSMMDTTPKKKSRKSSMPVKINRDTLIEDICQCRDDDEDDDDDDDAVKEKEGSSAGDGWKTYPLRGLRNSHHSSRKLARVPSSGDVSVQLRSQHMDLNTVLRVPRRTENHSCSTSGHTEDEQNCGVCELSMKREGQEGNGDVWMESKRNEREEQVELPVTVKEEERDPSYERHCSTHWRAHTLLTSTPRLLNDFTNNSHSKEEEEEEEADEEHESCWCLVNKQ